MSRRQEMFPLSPRNFCVSVGTNFVACYVDIQGFSFQTLKNALSWKRKKLEKFILTEFLFEVCEIWASCRAGDRSTSLLCEVCEILQLLSRKNLQSPVQLSAIFQKMSHRPRPLWKRIYFLNSCQKSGHSKSQEKRAHRKRSQKNASLVTKSSGHT